MTEGCRRCRDEGAKHGEKQQWPHPHAGIDTLAINAAGNDRGQHRGHAVKTERRRRMTENLNDIKADKWHDGRIRAAGNEDQ